VHGKVWDRLPTLSSPVEQQIVAGSVIVDPKSGNSGSRFVGFDPTSEYESDRSGAMYCPPNSVNKILSFEPLSKEERAALALKLSQGNIVPVDQSVQRTTLPEGIGYEEFAKYIGRVRTPCDPNGAPDHFHFEHNRAGRASFVLDKDYTRNAQARAVVVTPAPK
jgi:hypothetical protein